MNGYGSACIDILVSKDAGCVLTDLELVILAGTIWKLTIQVERRIVDTSCGQEDGMTDLVQLYLCEMRGKPEEAVVGARAVSSQRLSLGVFKFIADHSFAFVHCQVVLGNVTSLGSRCTKKCNRSLTFKLSQNLTFLFIFWPLFWREDHRTDESYCRSFFLIKLSLTWLSQFDHRF